MGVAIPSQHPAFVRRSQFNKLRVLLAVALIAVAGLTVAVVILASDNDKVSSSGPTAQPVGSINYGNLKVNPSTGYPTSLIRPDASSRYEGGPVSRYEAEGKYFIVPPGSSSSSQASEWGTAQYRLAKP